MCVLGRPGLCVILTFYAQDNIRNALERVEQPSRMTKGGPERID